MHRNKFAHAMDKLEQIVHQSWLPTYDPVKMEEVGRRDCEERWESWCQSVGWAMYHERCLLKLQQHRYSLGVDAWAFTSPRFKNRGKRERPTF